MTEAQLGAAMKAHALAEGKIGRIPHSPAKSGPGGHAWNKLSDEARARIIAMHRETGSMRKTSERLGYAIGTVSNVVNGK